jgi:protein-tyrosine phosphatase
LSLSHEVVSLIDIHCHLLPGIDDGSKHWEATLQMCRMAAQDGVSHIVATPHANYEFDYDRGHCLELIQELRVRVPEMNFSLGCELHFHYENISAALDNPERYAFEGTRYILVELSEYSSFNVRDSLYHMRLKGLIPIVAHPERNVLLANDLRLVEELVDLGCLMQLTANSLTGFWGRNCQKVSESMLKKNLVHFIASDAHSLRSRPPLLSAARDAAANLIGAGAADELVSANPAAAVNGREMEMFL